MKARVITLITLLLSLLITPGAAQTPALGNGAISIPVTPSGFSCYPVDGKVFPVAMPSVGCAAYAQNGSTARVAATYTNFTVTLSTPVPVGQSVRVDIGDFTSSPTQAMACTISAGGVSCSAVVPSGSPAFVVAVGDQLNVNFNNSTGTQSFIIESAKWLLQ